MRGWGVWSFRSRSEAQRASERERRARARARTRARVFSALALAACSTRENVDDRRKIGNEPIDERMIDLVAARDGISHDEARAHVLETLRWAAAAAETRPPEDPELDPVRRDHL